MLLLLAFSLIAGAGTGLTPCVLPLLPALLALLALPALLAASSTGGRRRPLAIVAGLTTTMTLTVIGVASLIDGLGFGDQFLRTLAVVVLGLFGLSLLVPGLSQALERPLPACRAMGRAARATASGRAWALVPHSGSCAPRAPVRSSARVLLRAQRRQRACVERAERAEIPGRAGQ